MWPRLAPTPVWGILGSDPWMSIKDDVEQAMHMPSRPPHSVILPNTSLGKRRRSHEGHGRVCRRDFLCLISAESFTCHFLLHSEIIRVVGKNPEACPGDRLRQSTVQSGRQASREEPGPRAGPAASPSRLPSPHCHPAGPLQRPGDQSQQACTPTPDLNKKGLGRDTQEGPPQPATRPPQGAASEWHSGRWPPRSWPPTTPLVAWPE